MCQILCEINFEDFRSAKSTISPHLEAVNFDFYEFCTFGGNLKFIKSTKFRAPKMAKPTDLGLLYSPN